MSEAKRLGSFDTTPVSAYEIEIDGSVFDVLSPADIPIGDVSAMLEAAQALADMTPEEMTAEGMAAAHRHARVVLSAYIPDLPGEVIDGMSVRVIQLIAAALGGLE